MNEITQEQIAEAARAIVFTTADLARASREDGVADLKAINGKVVLNFAKALCVERMHGHTSPEANYYLEQAIAALPTA